MKTISFILFLVFIQFLNEVFAQEKTWYPYKNKENKWLFLSIDGEHLNNELFDSIIPFSSSLPTRVMKNDKWGYLSPSGNYFLPIECHSIDIINSGHMQLAFLTATRKNPDGSIKYGIYQLNGTEILPIEFSRVDVLTSWTQRTDFNSGIAVQTTDENGTKKMGLYNFHGEELLPAIYDSILRIPAPEGRNFDDQCAYVSVKTKEGKWLTGGYNVTKKKWIFPCIYENIEYLNPHSENSSLDNRTRFVPLVKDKYAIAWNGTLTDRVSLDYYTLEGKFLFNSSRFDDVPITRSTHYVVADSIIGESKSGWSEIRVCDSLDRYILWFEDSYALYDIERGFLILPGKYRLNLTDRDGEIMIVAIDIKDASRSDFDLDGNPFVDKLTPSTIYFNGSYVVRDDGGQVVNMEPYRVSGKIEFDSLGNTCWVATKNGKYGIVNAAKKVLVPFRYKSIRYNDTHHLFYLSRKNTKNILNDKFKKVLRTRNTKWDVEENERFVLLTKKRTSDVYDLMKQDYLIRRLPKLSESTLDSVYKRWDTPIISHYYDLNTPFLQVYLENSGWNYYDFESTKLISVPVKSYFPVQPLLKDKQFVGFRYPLGSIKYDPYTYGYQFFDGFKLDGSDTILSIYHESLLDGFIVDRKDQKSSFFSEDGKFRFSFIRYLVMNDGYFFIEKQDGWQLLDSNYVEVFDEKFSSIKIEGSFSIGERNGSSYLITLTPTVSLSPPYKKNQFFNRTTVMAFIDDNRFNLISSSGEIILENITYHKRFDHILILRDSEMEYWISPLGKIYAKHSLN